MTRDDIIRKPLTEEQKLDLVTNWFSEDWAIKNALGLLDDYDTVRAHGIGEQAMNEKPEALRLAELLNEATTVLDEPFHHNAIAENCDKAAAELRRLHAENERLREVLKKLEYFSDGTIRRYPTESEVEAARQEQPR